MSEGKELNRWLSTDHTTFHVKVNTHNVIERGTENSHATSELGRATSKVKYVDWRDVAYSFAEECVSEIILRHA
jgi:hypothetical protein